MSDFSDRLTWAQRFLLLFGRQPEQQYNRTMPPGYISVKQAAERRGLSEQAVRSLCLRGRIAAEKISDVWLVNEEALKNFHPRKAGRPRNKKY